MTMVVFFQGEVVRFHRRRSLHRDVAEKYHSLHHNTGGCFVSDIFMISNGSFFFLPPFFFIDKNELAVQC